jgi:hypothetical protein
MLVLTYMVRLTQLYTSFIPTQIMRGEYAIRIQVTKYALVPLQIR